MFSIQNAATIYLQKANTVYIPEFIQLLNSRSITKYWNFCFTKLSKLK